MKIKVRGISSSQVADIQGGGLDANRQPAQIHTAEGLGNPCRHCLQQIAEGSQMLVLSYRPFAAPQPYAEIGPIFLHKKACEQYKSDVLPSWFENMEPAIIRGYDENHWICYKTAEVVSGRELTDTCKAILADKSVAYVHIRSKFNCFQCRVERD